MAAQTPLYGLNLCETRKRPLDFYRGRDGEGVPDKKTEQLLMLALACVCRCPQCTQEHVQGALKVGATEDEVAEVLLMTLYCASQVRAEHFCVDFARILGTPTDDPS